MSEPQPALYDTLTIALNGTLSGASKDLLGQTLCSIELDGWTSAALTFAVSNDGSTFVPLIDKDGEYTITDPNAIASGVVGIGDLHGLFAGWRYVKVRSGTAGSTTNQGAARTIKLYTRKV